MALTSEQIKVAAPTGNFGVGFYIEDTNSKWVDFSSYISRKQNRLAGIGVISHVIEKEHGVLQSSLQNVTLDNTDGFFSKPFPSGSTDGLRTVDGAVAVFDTTKNGSRSVLGRRRCKVTVTFASKEETTIGVFLIEGAQRDSKKKQISLKLSSLAQPLIDTSADKVRNGLSWYQNRPVSFLVEELLKTVYAGVGGELPATYRLPDKIEIPVRDGTLALSHYGQLPDWDGTTWRNIGKYGSATVFGTLGDLTDKLWCGLGNELWYWDDETETSTKVDEVILPSTCTIRWLKIFNGKLIGMASFDESETTYLTSIFIFRVTASGSTLTFNFASSGGDWNTPPVTTNTTSYFSGLFATRGGSLSISAALTLTQVWGVGQMPTTYAGSTTMADCGENPFSPYPHEARILNSMYFEPRDASKGTGMHLLISTNAGGTDVQPYSLWNAQSTAIAHVITQQNKLPTPGGYTPMVAASPSSDSDDYAWFQYYIGSQHCIAHSQYLTGSVDGYLVWIEANFVVNAPPTVNIVKLNLETLVKTTTPLGVAEFPTAMTCEIHSVGTTPTSVYIATMDWDDTGGTVPTSVSRNDRSEAKLYAYNINTNAISAIDPWSGLDENNENMYWTIVEMAPFESKTGTGGTGKIVASMINRSTGQFGVHKNITVPAGTLADFQDAIIHRGRQLKGLVYCETHDCMYAYEVGSGRVIKIPTTERPSAIDYGNPAVYDEYFLSAGLAVKEGVSNPVIFGISAPGPPNQVLSAPMVGRYYLFKADVSITDRIEVADFTDLSCWEAIRQLCQATNTIAGFDESGNFYLTERISSPSASPDFVVGDSQVSGLNTEIKNLTVDDAEDEIYNVAAVSPHASELGEPESTLHLVPRVREYRNPLFMNIGIGEDYKTSVKDLPNIPYFVDVRSVDKKTVRALCVRSGALWEQFESDANSGNSLWKYQVSSVEFVIRLVQAALSTDTFIFVSSVYGGDTNENISDPMGVQVGDFVEVVNPATDAVSFRRILDVDSNNSVIQLDASLGFALPDKTEVTVQKRDAISTGHDKAEWSDEGVTYVVAPASTGATLIDVATFSNLSIGTIIQFENDTDKVPGEYRIIGYEIGAGVGGSDRIKINPALPTDQSWVNSGMKVIAYWSPPGYGYQQNSLGQPGGVGLVCEIGGTKVFIQFDEFYSDQLGFNVNQLVRPGDLLTVRCPGLSAKADAQSSQRFIAMDSVRKHGRREYPTIENRFVNRRVARQLAQYVVEEYRWPKSIVNTTGVLRPDIKFLAPDGSVAEVDVFDPVEFAYRPSLSERCTIREISHNLSSRETAIVFKSIEPQ